LNRCAVSGAGKRRRAENQAVEDWQPGTMESLSTGRADCPSINFSFVTQDMTSLLPCAFFSSQQETWLSQQAALDAGPSTGNSGAGHTLHRLMPRDCTRLVAACRRRPGRQTMWITPAWHSKERLAEECFFSAAPGDALTARSSRMVARDAVRPAMLAGRRPSRGLGCWRCNATGAPRSSLLPARKAPAHTKAVKVNEQERESARHQT